MVDRFFPDYEFDTDRSFMHINNGVGRFKEVHAEIVVVGDDADQAQLDANQALADAAAAQLDADEANGTLDGWGYDLNRTYINGGYIQTGTVTAAQIMTRTITGNELDDGTVASVNIAATLQSDNYSATAGSEAGWKIERDTGNATFNNIAIRDAAVVGGDISAATMTGGTVQTASSGARVVLTQSAENRIRFYNGNNTLVGQIGEGSYNGSSIDELVIQQPAGIIRLDPSNAVQIDGQLLINYSGTQHSLNVIGSSSLDSLRVGGLTETVGNVRPTTAEDGNPTLGTSVARWKSVWAVDGTINTSDGRGKPTVEDSTLGLDFVRQIRPVSFVREGRSRPHYGFVAQQVKEVIDSFGVDFAGYVDPQVAEPDAVREDGEPPFLGLRYSEFIAPTMKAVQELAAQFDALAARVGALEQP